jgi:hypothetical protein
MALMAVMYGRAIKRIATQTQDALAVAASDAFLPPFLYSDG